MNNRSQSYCFHCIITICFFVLFHPLLNTFASPPTPSKCRPDQRDALLELKDEFHSDDPSAATASWNKSVDCCSWDGVTCDNISGKVISLGLYSNYFTNYTSLKSSSALFKLQHLRSLVLSDCNLQGEIPSSIRNLSQLTDLDLSYNQLVGEVPASISSLSQLRYIDLYHNHLVGEVPVSIGNLNQLRDIRLSFNNLSGNIPSSFANLTKLETLFLNDNSFSGFFPSSLLTIPSLFDIDLSLSQLRYMDLSRNNFTGNIPTSFANLTNLESLSLFENQFTGGDIVLANLTNLSFIDLSFNNFTSSIFPDLSGLHKLETFYGCDNSFSGSFPSSLFTIPSLVHIDLRTNQMEGPIDFGNTSSKLRNLEYLDLSHNNFVGKVPRSLSKFVNLFFLDLSYNKLEGEVPHCVWTSSKLESAELSHNSFTNFGKSVEVVDGASSLRRLDIGSNSLQGPIPQWICKLSLKNLVFSNNHLTDPIPQCLKSSTSFVEINLRNNSLSGFLPDLCTNNGSQLKSLDVSHNDLKGKLPKSLMNCTGLELLNVRGNKIKDKFPFWLGSVTVLLLGSNAFYGPIFNSSVYFGFPNLRIIDISNNNFVGSLPQDYFANWSQMSSVWNNEDHSGYVGTFEWDYEDSMEMVYKGVDTNFDRIFKGFKAIDFSGNRFSGHIPSSIGGLSALRLLNLSGNTFTGSIPPSLANITTLEALDVSRNNLYGKTPLLLGNLSFLSYINFSHNHLEGLVPQSTQFETQKCSSFAGNSRLYGLEKMCGEIHAPVTPTSQQPEESLSEPKEEKISWIAATIAYVPGVFCGLVIGHIFTSYKGEWFMQKF